MSRSVSSSLAMPEPTTLMSHPALETTCRLITDSDGDGVWNMAVDEHLLDTAIRQDIATLRFYQWQRPTLSLGYFQSHEDRQSHTASRDCDIVRRSTGGGAILHDRELTYSLALPLGSRSQLNVSWLVNLFHESLIQTLATLNISAQLVIQDDCDQAVSAAEAPFLCFQRRAVGDVVLDGHKIAGSAQRRRQGAVLQHGSVLLASSAHAPELLGCSDLSQQILPASKLREAWLARLQDRLSIDDLTYRIPAEERQQILTNDSSKFTSSAWLRRR